MEWSLKELYEGFDSKKLLEDSMALEKKVKEINEFMDNVENYSNVDILRMYISLFTEVRELATKLFSFSSLSFSVNTNNSDAIKLKEKIQKTMVQMTKPGILFSYFLKKLGKEELEKLIDTDEKIKEFKFHFFEIYEGTKYLLSMEEEVIISKFKSTASDSFAMLQNQLSSTLTAEFDGKTLPMQELRNLAYSSDKDIRKRAYETELKAYTKNEIASTMCINSIKGEVLTLSELRGFSSVLEKTLYDARMKKETLDALLDGIREYLPKFREYFKSKAKYLGYAESLPFYDIFAPIGEIPDKIEFDKAKEIVLDNFYTFSDELGDFAKNAFEKKWLDAFPKKGKRGGAFCSNIKPIGESRVLLNFTGSMNNVITMAHELGHAFHGQQIFAENIINTVYPMPLAETASIFCETIVKKSLINSSTGLQKMNILETSIQGYAQVIVDIYSRFIFESNLFERRKEAQLSVDDLKALMLNAQKEAYGDALDSKYLHPYMWMNKVHYYYSERNFYNFPYAFGLLFAKGLYAKYLEDKDSFVKKYNYMLRMTGKMNIEDVAKIMDIDITKKEFWLTSLNEIASEIDELIKMM